MTRARMTTVSILLALLTLMLGAGCGEEGNSLLQEGPGEPRSGIGDGVEEGKNTGGSGDGFASSAEPSAGGAAGAGGSGGGGGDGDGDSDGSRMAAAPDGSGPGEDSGSGLPSSSASGVANSPGAGVLTAAAWDDNRNFERFSQYRSELLQGELLGAPNFDDQEHADAHDLFSGDREANSKLDISLIIDATGSMGDEIAYLQTEFNAMSQAIEANYPNAEQRWSLVVYRDDTDQVKLEWFDFREDAADFREKLGEQFASGGGDFPEAPDAAIKAMNQLAWRDGETTARLAFWVADAPHHNENAGAMSDAIRGAQALDIHMYPVASSGVDELTELTMRSGAQLTGGRYLFLTDDSGVGGAHKEPSIPCYFVTKLDDAILRMVDIEMSGDYREPAADDILRTGGDPQDGACTLSSGEEVLAF